MEEYTCIFEIQKGGKLAQLARHTIQVGDTGNQRAHHNLPPELHTPPHHVQRHIYLRQFAAFQQQIQQQTMLNINY
jgi:hypothetical protein